MNKKATGILAGAAGAALLMGGGTFALWSDSAGIENVTLATGTLSVGEVTENWVDATEDRHDAPESISDLSDFKLVPGDHLIGTYTFDVDLVGNNMVAELGVDIGTATGDLGLAGVLDYDITVTDGGGATLNLNAATPVRLASADNEQPGASPALHTVPVGGETITVELDVRFPEGSTGNKNESITLTNPNVTLQQIVGSGSGGGWVD